MTLAKHGGVRVSAGSMTPLGLVLAGGRSSRLGRDKAAIEEDGIPRVRRFARLVAGVVGGVVVSVGSGGAGEIHRGIPTVDDTAPDAGPLAGIVAAHEAFPGRRLLVVAVDLFGIDAATLQRLLDAADPDRFDLAALAAQAFEGPEPLCAVWERDLLRRAARAFHAGERSPRAVLAGARHVLVPRGRRSIINVNTPADLAATQQRYGGIYG